MRDLAEQLAVAATEAARLARAVDEGHLDAPTPCPDYDVRALIEHLMQEIVLHSWDLAAATGQASRFPDPVTETVLRRLDTETAPAQNNGWGWYRAPVPTTSPSLLERAVARSGRDPAWRAR